MTRIPVASTSPAYVPADRVAPDLRGRRVGVGGRAREHIAPDDDAVPGDQLARRARDSVPDDLRIDVAAHVDPVLVVVRDDVALDLDGLPGGPGDVVDEDRAPVLAAVQAFREMSVSVTPLIDPLAAMKATPLTAPQLSAPGSRRVDLEVLDVIVAPSFSTTAPTNAAPDWVDGRDLVSLPSSV